MTLLSSLTAREEGRATPSKIKWMELTRQAIHLHLSNRIILKKIHRGGVAALAIDPAGGRYLLSGGIDAKIGLFDLENQRNNDEICPMAIIEKRPTNDNMILRQDQNSSHRGTSYGHEHAISSVNWYPYDTGLFTSSSMDGSLKVWDTNTLQEAHSFSLGNKVYAHAMSPIAHRYALIAAGTSDPKIRLCDMRSGAFSHQLIGHSGTVLALHWSPKSEYQLVSGGGDGTVRLWDIRASGGSQQCLLQFDLEFVLQTSDSFGVHTSDNSYSRKKSKTEPDNFQVAHHSAVNGLHITSDGFYLVTTGLDNRVRLWNMSTGHNLLVHYPEIFNTRSKQVFFTTTYDYPTHPAFLFYPVGNSVHMYDLLTGELILKLDNGHYEEIQTVVSHPRVMQLFSGGNDQQILTWTGADERCAAEVFGAEDL